MKSIALVSLFSLMMLNVSAQEAQFPIVKGFGGIYDIPEATEKPDPDAEYKIIIDLVSGADDPAKINRMVDNVARMMNLHGLAGVPQENLKVKVAVHGGAIFSILNDEAYKERFGTENPNLPVYRALKDAGVGVYICGQSLLARDMETDDVWEDATLALSMLTTLTTYVPQGYMLMKF
jgi:intracellular sulfur oxidation DsrE/DsrF family protein